MYKMLALILSNHLIINLLKKGDQKMKIKKVVKELDLGKITIVSLKNEEMSDQKGGVIRRTINLDCTWDCSMDAGCDSIAGCNSWGWCGLPR